MAEWKKHHITISNKMLKQKSNTHIGSRILFNFLLRHFTRDVCFTGNAEEFLPQVIIHSCVWDGCKEVAKFYQFVYPKQGL